MNRLERLEQEVCGRPRGRQPLARPQGAGRRFVATFDTGAPVVVAVAGATAAPAPPPPTPERPCPPPAPPVPPAAVSPPPTPAPPPAPPKAPPADGHPLFAPSEQQALEDLAWVNETAPPPAAPPPPPAGPAAHSLFDRPSSSPRYTPTAHAVFDRAVPDLSRATTYDAGTFSLDGLFDEFDRQLAAAAPPRRPAGLSVADARADVAAILRPGAPPRHARPLGDEDAFLDFYRRHLDRQYPNGQPDDSYSRGRDYYTARAFDKAGVNRSDWQPELGFAANRGHIVRVYDYYRDTFLARPDRFLWAGLGRLAGGAVVGGLDRLPGDPSLVSRYMVLIGKDIFLDLAWLHEAHLDDPAKAVTLAREHDTRYPGRASYADAFLKIGGGSPAEVAAGNLLLLANEQFTVIQPLYDRLLEAGGVTGVNGFTGAVHPYHRDFVEAVPGGQVLNAADRWKWITEPDGMWDKWAALPADERERLARLPMSELTARRFGPARPEFVRPGAP